MALVTESPPTRKQAFFDCKLAKSDGKTFDSASLPLRAQPTLRVLVPAAFREQVNDGPHCAGFCCCQRQTVGSGRSDDDGGMAGDLWVRAVFVSIGIAVEHREYQQHQAADQGDERYEIPPAASADVVKAPDGDR
jgi:hypothetical protein